MNIDVKGYVEKEFKADTIFLDYYFEEKTKTYESALEKGTEKVKIYMDKLVALGINRDDIKTQTFNVSRGYEKKTFIYRQRFNVKFPFDIKKLTEIVEETSSGNYGVNYSINFTVKDTRKVQEELYKDAFANAKAQAQNIAKAAGMKLKTCLQASSDEVGMRNYYSRTSYEPYERAQKEARVRANAVTKCASAVADVFMPEDVIISQRIYTVWLAE